MRTITRSTGRARGRLVIAGASALSLALVGFGAATATAAPGSRTAFPGSVPAFVSTANDSGAPADTTEEGEIYLNLKDELGAQQLATAVSTPGSRSYGKYLSPQAWIKEYAPSRSDLATVEKYLTDSGFTITDTPASREYVAFRGTPDLFGDAFGTELRDYTVAGTTVSAPSSAPSLPNSIASKVLGLDLGNSRVKLTQTYHSHPGPGSSGVKADKSSKLKGSGVSSSGEAKASSQSTTSNEQCSTYYGQYQATRPAAYGKTSFPTYICGYLPGQLRSAAGVNGLARSGVDGRGVTIGIVDAYDSPTALSDTNTYMKQTGTKRLKYSDISYPASSFSDQVACNQPSGWQTEQTLDIQSAHSVAPGAKIVYSGGYNCGAGLDLALSKIIDHGLADLVSNSYGGLGEDVPSDVVRGSLNIQIQAAGEGIGLYFSTGDDGDDSVDFNGTPAANFYATSPFVTAVGGTTEYINASGKDAAVAGWGDILDQVVDGAYTADLPGDLYGGGGGGGISTLFAQPAYQKGVVPTSLAGIGTAAARVIPDVSDLGDPYTGFQIAVSPITDDTTLATGPLEYQTWGGTSLASPLIAGKMALVQQATHRRIGFANPLLYQQAKQGSNGFNDVTNPSSTPAMAYTGITSGKTYLVTQNQGLSLQLAKGYDDFTGIGTLDVPRLSKDVAKSGYGHSRPDPWFHGYGHGGPGKYFRHR